MENQDDCDRSDEELQTDIDRINNGVNVRWSMRFEEHKTGVRPETYMILTNDKSGETHKVLLSGSLRVCIIRYRGTGWRVQTDPETGVRTIVARTGKSKEHQTLARKILGLPPSSSLDGKDLVIYHKNGDDMDYRHGNVELVPQCVHQVRWKLLRSNGPRLYENRRSDNCIQKIAEVYFDKVRYGIKGNSLIPGMTEFLEKVYDRFCSAVVETSDPQEIHRRLQTIITNARVNRPRPAPPVEEIVFETKSEQSMENNEEKKALQFTIVNKGRNGVVNLMARDGDSTILKVERSGIECSRVRIDTALASRISKHLWRYSSRCSSGLETSSNGRISLLDFVAQESGIVSPRDGYSTFFAGTDFSDFRASNILYMDNGIRVIRLYLVKNPNRIHKYKIKVDDGNGTESNAESWYAGVALHGKCYRLVQTVRDGVKERVSAFIAECRDAIFSHIHADECARVLEKIHRTYVRAVKKSERQNNDGEPATSTTSVLLESVAVAPSCCSTVEQQLDLGPSDAPVAPALQEYGITDAASAPDTPAELKPAAAQWTDSDEAALMELIDRKQAHLEQSLRQRFDILRNIAQMKI